MPDIASAERTARVLRDCLGDGPFTRTQALGFVSARSLRTSVTRGAVVRVARGYFALPGAVTEDLQHYRTRIAAALDARPGSVASHESALALLGLSLPWFASTWSDQPVRLTAPVGGRVRRSGLVVTERQLPSRHVSHTEWGGATGLLRTAVDLARRLPPPLALIAADECCARAVVQVEVPLAGYELQGSDTWVRALVAGRADDCNRWMSDVLSEVPVRVGRRRAGLVADWVDPAAESPGESMSRARLLAAGLPRPVVGLPVEGAEGERYFADMAWDWLGVLAEVDGYGKYGADPWSTFRDEKRREDSLRAAGWTVIRWTVSDMLRTPDRVVARVHRVLREAGWQ